MEDSFKEKTEDCILEIAEKNLHYNVALFQKHKEANT